MQRHEYVIIISIAAVFATFSCFYDPDRSKISDEDAVVDSGSDDQDAGGWPWSGIGMECTLEDNACEGYEADYCLADPYNPKEPGVCTITDCIEQDCPSEYTCCDCTLVMGEELCVPSTYEEALSAYCDCSV